MIYVDVVVREKIYLLMAYSKNVQADLTMKQKQLFRQIVKSIKEE